MPAQRALAHDPLHQIATGPRVAPNEVRPLVPIQAVVEQADDPAVTLGDVGMVVKPARDDQRVRSL